MIKIYRLEYNGEVVYIGKTKLTLKQRKSVKYKSIPYWRDCKIILEEETNDVTREDYWINYYKEKGCKLYNKQRGIRKLDNVEYRKEWKLNNENYYRDYKEKNKEKIAENHKKYLDANRDLINQRRREKRKQSL